MLRRRFLRFFALLFALLFLGWGVRKWWRHRGYHPYVAPLAVAPFFSDEFGGAPYNPVTRAKLDPLKWQVQGDDQILQRTQWGLSPAILRDANGTGFVRLSLNSFNPKPEKAGRFFLSTQLTSLDRWKLENGIEYEARLRMNHLPPGLIIGYFAYGDAGAWRKTYQKTEADFEFLTHKGGGNVWTHIWDNWNPLRDGQNDGSLWRTDGVNWNDGGWNTFKIRWYPDRTEWICNDYLIRDERRVRPGSPMGVWFNLWAPNSDWEDAYDATLAPSRDAAHNKTYFYDVDYVRVRRIPAAPDAPRIGAPFEKSGTENAFIMPGDAQNLEAANTLSAQSIAPNAVSANAPFQIGSGLRAEYFAAPDLTGKSVVRLDPRVDFDWGTYAPDSQLPRNGFSARWTGFIVARRSETYRFTVRNSGGTRLWLGGKLWLDDWRAQGQNTRGFEVALRAGERLPIRLETCKPSGAGLVRLIWQSASTPREIVPQSQLFVPVRPAPPRFFPAGGQLSRPQIVTIRSATRGAIIRYTRDGKPPTRLSPRLPNGAKIRVGYTALLRAEAVVAGEVPSERARAYFVLDDKTPPQLAITTPAPMEISAADSAEEKPLILATLPRIEGFVSDGGSGVSRVDVVITRGADHLKWKQGQWVAPEWGIGAEIEGETWQVSEGLPRGADLRAGDYEIKAVAYDLAGNIKGARLRVRIAAPIDAGEANETKRGAP